MAGSVNADATLALLQANYMTIVKPMNANKMDDVSVKTMKTSSGKVRKRQTTETKRRKLRRTVVKMLAVMEPNPESSDPGIEFLGTGRTGRRNAMADILGPHATVTSGDLPERLQSLSTVAPQRGRTRPISPFVDPPGNPLTERSSKRHHATAVHYRPDEVTLKRTAGLPSDKDVGPSTSGQGAGQGSEETGVDRHSSPSSSSQEKVEGKIKPKKAEGKS